MTVEEMAKFSDVTQRLKSSRSGQEAALQEVLRLVNQLPLRPPAYDELRAAPDVTDEIKDFVFGLPEPADPADDSYIGLGMFSFDSAEERYALLSEIRSILTQFKDRGDALADYKSGIPLWTTYWDQGGRIKVEPSIAAYLLDGIELDRVRRCVGCSGLFYATRADRQACSRRCATRVAMRKKRPVYARARSQKRQKRNGGKNGNL